MAHDVFISYEHHDKAVADAVCAALESRHIRCWIAPRDVTPGMAWAEEIVNAVAGSKILVLVFSASTNSAQQVLREVNLAADARIPILPFRLEDVALSPSFRFYVGTAHWLDALTPPLEEHLRRLGDAVERWLEQQAAAGEATAETKSTTETAQMPSGTPDPGGAATAGAEQAGGSAGVTEAAAADRRSTAVAEAAAAGVPAAAPQHFCGHCGAAVAAETPYCGHCGAPLRWDAGRLIRTLPPPPLPPAPPNPAPAALLTGAWSLILRHRRPAAALAGAAVLVIALVALRLVLVGVAPGCPLYASSASMTYDGRNQQTVLFGGVNAQGDEVNDTCTWNGTAWTRLNPSARPPARDDGGLAYDAGHQQVVLFGGQGSGTYRGHGTVLADTWTWDGRTWTQHAAPGPVVSHGLVSAVYDAGRQQLLLVDDAGGTWAWSGSAWSRVAAGGGPPSGNPGAMAYDARNKQVVLLDPNGVTWTWDGFSWMRQPAVPPFGGGIAGTAMAYAAAAQQMVLVSGTGDTSTWDGRTWTRQTPAHQPSSAIGTARLAYDEARQQVVLYLPDYARRAAGTWTWDGRDWTQR